MHACIYVQRSAKRCVAFSFLACHINFKLHMSRTIFVALFEQVQKIQGELLTGLSLDETLFARLRENQLLTQEEGGVIIAHLRGHNYSAAGTYFVNSVLFRWTFEVFESNVRQLIEALQSHDDCENQSAAGKLQRALLECGLETHDLCPVAATTNGNS